MEELALITFLAETAKPMFTYEAVERVIDLVFVGAVVTQRTVAFSEGFAWGAVGVESESVFSSEEVGEGEVEGWRSVL